MSGREVRTGAAAATGERATAAGSVVRSPDALRLGAKALVTSAGEVLVVKERHADGTPFWTLPGGGMYPCETLTECLRREIAEELGCQLRIDEPAALCRYDHRSCHATTLYTVFRSTVRSPPAPNPSEGIFDVDWVTRDSPPEELLSAFRRLFESLGEETPDRS